MVIKTVPPTKYGGGMYTNINMGPIQNTCLHAHEMVVVVLCTKPNKFDTII